MTILRQVLRREGPVAYDGPELSLPYRGPGALGQGKALKSILHAPSDIPIWLASVGPRNTELCAELCEGWLPMGLPPEGIDDPEVSATLDRGFARRTDGRGRQEFEIFSGLTVVITDDVQGWLDRQRPYRATYVGGMGSASHNYHVESMARRGFVKEAARIQELFLAGRRDEAIAAMPDEAMLQGALVGSAARIRDQWEAGGVVAPGATGVIVAADRAEELELIADLVGRARCLTTPCPTTGATRSPTSRSAGRRAAPWVATHAWPSTTLRASSTPAPASKHWSIPGRSSSSAPSPVARRSRPRRSCWGRPGSAAAPSSSPPRTSPCSPARSATPATPSGTAPPSSRSATGCRW